jgi:hypothetical protein
MPEPSPIKAMGLMLLVLGVLLAAGGLLLLFMDKLPGVGKLPGDVVIRGGRWTLFFPITTFLLVSLLLTLLFNLFFRR